MKYFVWLNEQQQGPFDEEEIQRLVSEGQINQETLLCPEVGDLNWTPAKELFPSDAPSESGGEKNAPTESRQIEEEAAVSPQSEPNVGTWEERWQNQQYDVPGAGGTRVEYADDGARLGIHLISGLELRVKAVRLYDETVLVEINSKRAKALKNFQGVSTGIGSIGSIEWVLATSVVIGAIEGTLSAAAASSGSNLLAEVLQMERRLRMNGVFLPIGKIENIETPIPGLWRVPYSRTIRSWREKQYENQQVPSAYVHSGDEFILVQADDGSARSIRWSTVEQYVYLKSAE